MIELFENIWAVYLDTAFWLLLGLFAGGLVKAYIPQDAMQRWLGGRGFKAVSRAALFGAPLPLCSCGVLPAAIGMRRSGASKEATVSFLISTPETSIDSVAVTYALMGPVMAIYRPLAALMSAMITGMMTSFIKEELPVKETDTASSCCSSVTSCGGKPVEKACCDTESADQPKEKSRFFSAIHYAGAELLDDISKWLMLGIVIAGVIATVIPPGWLAQWGGGLSAMLVMLVVGIPMYICAVASTPIAAGLLLAGVSPGTVLVFLLVGPATNIAGLMLIKKELGNKVTVVYLLGIAVISVLMGLLLDVLIATQGWQVEAILGEEHRLLPEALVLGSAILLLVLAITPARRLLIPVLK
ncbi:MAG: SO_0444 family Cu/Zn efflux transporter [Gammaproteobacteria bacterium]|nr:SO_0444 family Cu/Zn efflux transporter [Gammaproteobacteria bacterium]MCW9056267.1 SO_0444 family Cu/Zn efflux transporter [Gammaproteobacteria bacterium]